MQIKGLDVSEFQGNVDWEKVKAAGYQFAMLRAGYGFNTIDPQFKRNASECNRIAEGCGKKREKRASENGSDHKCIS